MTFSSNLFSPPGAQAIETIIPVIFLNEEQKGEYLIQMTEDRDLLIKVEDLKEIGLVDPKGKSQEIEGVSYLSLKSMAGITFSYIESKQTLKIQAAPDLLARKTLDLSRNSRKDIHYQKENSVFLNYGINYIATNGFKFDSFTGSSELGIRVRDFLFLSDSIFSVSDQETKFNRLMSKIIYDRPDRMDTFILGDFNSRSNNLGSYLTLGGFSYSKNFSANPNFLKTPVFNYQGFVNTPSEVDVYLNGVRIGSQRISPGGFDIRNITGYGGSQDLDIVIKDAFGREQHIANTFYITDSLLARGLHEYSYNIGFQRKNIGAKDDQYGDLAFMGFHRYGVTNNLTLGLSGEAGSGIYNLGPQMSLAPYNIGIFELTLAGSRDNGEKTGFAGMAAYGYQGKRFNGRISATGYTEDYATVSSVSNTNLGDYGKTKLEVGGTVGYGSPSFGSLGLNYLKTIRYNNTKTQTASMTYSRGIGKKINISFSLNETIESGLDKNSNDLGMFIGFVYYPWKETIMTSAGMNQDGFKGSIQLQKSAPQGEGYGYRATVNMNQEGKDTITQLDPYFQYNGKYGIYSTEITFENGAVNNTQSYRFSASGAIVYVGKTFGFTRPVNDSFAVVQVGQVPGVRVYHFNQEVGKTNRSGEIILPNFVSYDENQIRIEDEDIPVDFALPGVSKNIFPSLRSGSLIKFEAKKVQAFTGMLKIIKDGKKLPVEYIQIAIKIEGKTITFPTGRDGEFFIENIVPGTFKTFFKYAGKEHTFDIILPKSDEIIIDGGEIIVQAQP